MSRVSRRRFVHSAIVTVIPWAARVRGDTPPASDRLRVAMIGLANRGHENLNELVVGGAEIAVLCDVDEPLSAPARQQFPKAAFETDFRRVMDRKDIDAVCIATTDHTHAIATLLALQAGKHVYCEKPLTHNIVEARKVADAAKKYNRVTQMGTQI